MTTRNRPRPRLDVLAPRSSIEPARAGTAERRPQRWTQLARILALAVSYSTSVMWPRLRRRELRQLIGLAGATGRFLDVALEGRVSCLGVGHRVLRHVVATGDQVHEHAEERQEDHEEQPQRLGEAAHLVAAEDVHDHVEQGHQPDDPQEEYEHRPEDAQQWVVVREEHARIVVPECPSVITRLG